LFNNNNVKSFLSQGENRSIVLSLKLTEKEILEDKTNKLAIFLFDDLFSELDGNRRTTILKQIDINQTFITTTDVDLVINNLQSKFNILPINKKKL
jgi:Recombinational DNA repair ATPase (RecF pathway)